MIYESAVTETFEIFPLAWVPIGIIIAIGVLVLIATVFGIIDADGEMILGAWFTGAVLSGMIAIFGILLPSTTNEGLWQEEQIETVLEQQGYTQVSGSFTWTANLDGDYRTGTASVNDDVVIIKDLTDLEVVN